MTRRAMLAVLTTSVLLAAAGCSSGLPALTEEQREKRYYDLSCRFAEAVKSEDWTAAYGMTSSKLQARMSLEQFTQVHQKARTEYGWPLSITCDDGFVDQAVLADGWGDEFPGVAPKHRQAFTHAYFVLERDDQGEVWRCYDLRQSWDDAEGADKIGWFEYAWCD